MMPDLSSVLTVSGQTVRISVPLVLAAVGGAFSERSGVINIALEGIILNGAFCAVLGTWYTGDPWIGVMAAVLGGILTAFLHAIVSIRFRANQIISGVAINLFAIGITKFFLQVIFHSSSNSSRVEGLGRWPIPWLSGVPDTSSLAGLRDVFCSPIIVLAALIVAVAHVVMFKTPWGLRLRAVGEHPVASDTLGLRVAGMRYSGVLISGALAGLGGAWLALDQHQFTDNMSAGRGFIAIAAMIFGKWTPLGATAACLLFGFAEAMQIRLQGAYAIPTQFIQMIPFVLTMVVLAGAIGRATPPAALGVPYTKGQ